MEADHMDTMSQIEDIVVRKVGCQLGDVVISSIKTEE